MRKFVFCVSLAAVILLAEGEIHAQNSLSKANSCQPSAEEILSVIKSAYGLSPGSEAVLIAGEIQTLLLRIPEKRLSATRPSEPFTATKILAMLGGALKTAKHPFYLIRKSGGGEAETVSEVDLREIKKGRAIDLEVKNGDVIFVPRGCVGGKLMPPAKTPNRNFIPGTDYPINAPGRRAAD